MSVQNNLFGELVDTQGDLFDRFGVPPFSVLDTRQGYWHKRANYWKTLGIKSEAGRKSDLLYYGTMKRFDYYRVKEGKRSNSKIQDTSIFDPYLSELMYSWFCPAAGKIIDPFAGGSVRGIVSNYLGYDYTGIDLRQEQIDSNKEQGETICKDNCPDWFCGDSEEVLTIFDNEYFDFAFTCPPYHDLEKYSDDPRDLSNMNYNSFLIKYQKIISETYKKLKQDSFFVIVVGDIRDKKGNYKSFVKDTTTACEIGGFYYYNEFILVNAIGSLPIRITKQFDSSRKNGKCHQNVLVFLKGDAKKATEKIKNGV